MDISFTLLLIKVHLLVAAGHLTTLDRQQCFIPGDCENTECFLIMGEVKSVEECISICWKRIKCSWSTFNPSTGYCSLFQQICNEINFEKCPLCLNNEKDCIYGKKETFTVVNNLIYLI